MSNNFDIQITKEQERRAINTPLEIQGKEKFITGPMTFGGSKAAPNGSFSLKVTSSMLNDVEADRAELREAYMETFDKCCDVLFADVDRRRRENAGEDIAKGEGQTNLLDQIDEMKNAAKGGTPQDPGEPDGGAVVKKVGRPKKSTATGTVAAKKTAEA